MKKRPVVSAKNIIAWSLGKELQVTQSIYVAGKCNPLVGSFSGLTRNGKADTTNLTNGIMTKQASIVEMMTSRASLFFPCLVRS